MNVKILILRILRFVFACWAILLIWIAPLSKVTVAIGSIICLSLFIPEMLPKQMRRRMEGRVGGLACLLTAILLIQLFDSSRTKDFWDSYYAIVAWMVAAIAGMGFALMEDDLAKPRWRNLTFVWLCLGELVWFVGAYLKNRPTEFYLGIAVFLLLSALTKKWFRPPYPVLLAINTWILLLIFVPLADLIVRPRTDFDSHPEIAGRDYLYSESRKDPKAYSRYAVRYAIQFERLVNTLYAPDPNHHLSYVLRTNCELSFFQSRIHINSDGFRGPELACPKGRTYRIVALGESTTFGFTLTKEHKPWPEVLANLIREKLAPDRPIEVINAGVPGYTLEDNLHRLSQSILALKPDMIISYHGYNGFRWLYPALPSIFVTRLPQYCPRPVWLLAECEYRVRVYLFRRSVTVKNVPQTAALPDILNSPYARVYEALVSLSATNGIHLVVANYSMAVNATSEPDAKEFYRNAGFPNAYSLIKVNEMHSALVEAMGRRHPEVIIVDTHPQLDGESDKFTDLLHFDPAGDRQLAANVFGSISNLLSKELAGASLTAHGK